MQKDLLCEVERLRQRVAELEAIIETESHGEDELNARADALGERVKELKCLYRISSLLKDRHTDLGAILQKAVNVLPSAWQYPGQACASITVKSRRYQTSDYRESRWRQQADIIVEGEHIGLVEIGYAEPVAGQREPEFLEEEQALLSTVGERLGEIIALKDAQTRLTTYEGHLRSLASELTLAEERQRRQLAISLHDRIGQGLAVARLKLETLKHLPPSEHQPKIDDILTLIKQIISDTRSLTFEISPPILYELGLKQAVSWLADHLTRQFGLRVEVRCDEDIVDLSEGARVMLFRSIQELLANTVKHAQALNATVLLQREGKKLRVLVEDDGVGFDAASRGGYPCGVGGFGLFSIRERIAHLGGQVAIESQPGRGTRVHIVVPGVDAGKSRGEERSNEDPAGGQSQALL